MPKSLTIENPAESNSTPIGLKDAGNSSDQQQVCCLDKQQLQLQNFLDDCIERKLKGKEIINLAKEMKINLKYRRIIDLLKQYRSSGIEAITRKERRDKGEKKSFSDDVLFKIQKFFVDSQQIRDAYDKAHDYYRKFCESFVKAETAEEFKIIDGKLCQISNGNIISIMSCYGAGVYISAGREYRFGSYKSAQAYLYELKQEFADALHINKMGIQDYRLKRQHSMKIDYSNLPPGALLSGDGKMLNILVISEDWKYLYRPWIMDWECMPTRRISYEATKTPNADAVANSLCRAISEWGIPKQLNYDRGKEYKNTRFDTMLKALNLEKRLSTAKLARAKPVESFHNTLDHLLISLPGQTGKHYSQMPEQTKKMLADFTGIAKKDEKITKALFEKGDFALTLNNNSAGRMKSSKRRFLHISELIELLDEALDKYHHRVHRGLKHDKLGKKVYKLTCNDPLIKEFGERMNTPAGRYEYYLKAGFKPVYARPEIVSVFASNFELRTVNLTTGILFNNEHYFTPKLKKFAGQRVLIRFTNINSKVIYVFHSPLLQKIKDRKQLTNEILKDLKFVDLCEMVESIDYNDEKFKDKLILQRSEEREKKMQVKGKLKRSSSEGMITQMIGTESNITEIHSAEMELIQKSEKPKSFKNYKQIFHVD